LLWSFSTVGSVFQESGSAVPFTLRTLLALEQGSGWEITLRESIKQLSNTAVWLRGDFSGLPLVFGLILWVALAIGLIKKWRERPRRIEKFILFPMLISGTLLIIAHAGVRWYPRPWYFIPNSVAFAIVSGVVLHFYLRRPKIAFTAFTVTSLIFLFGGAIFWQSGYFPWQREMLAANSWLSQNVKGDERVASFNSGIYSYYNNFQVVNLDGVINHDAYVAIQNESIMAYLKEHEINYLLDSDLAIWSQYAAFMGEGFPDSLREYAILGEKLGDELGFLRVYEIK
jgi:hypothetical protein